MASGKSVENWKWYVKRKEASKSGAAGGADCGPYDTEAEADAALLRRQEKTGTELYTELVNIATLQVHPALEV